MIWIEYWGKGKSRGLSFPSHHKIFQNNLNQVDTEKWYPTVRTRLANQDMFSSIQLVKRMNFCASSVVFDIKILILPLTPEEERYRSLTSIMKELRWVRGNLQE